MQITPHFALVEFSSHDGIAYPTDWLTDRLVPLCKVLEAVRAACGNQPMTIISGYRSPEHNLQVNGAKHSQHVEGRAADISIKGVMPAEVHSTTLHLFETGAIAIGGLGYYPPGDKTGAGWVHIDTRFNSDGRLRRWEGAKTGDEQP